jgi:signal transduction histidine kinase
LAAPGSEITTSLGDRGLSERLARTLRHELGDFLQKVYATVAILQKRLPPDWAQERDVLGRLRVRAESCKHLLDAVQDFLCPVSLACEPIDLAQVAATLVAAAVKHHPQLAITVGTAAPAVITADPGRVSQVGDILLANACEAAHQRVAFDTLVHPDKGEVECTVTDDGPGVQADAMARLFTPFFTTRTGHAGLGLALAHKIVLLHGGRINATNLPEGGFRMSVVLPVEPPPDAT